MSVLMFHHGSEEGNNTCHCLVISRNEARWEIIPFKRWGLVLDISLRYTISILPKDHELNGTYYYEGERRVDKNSAIN
jgi:hypothetical protein